MTTITANFVLDGQRVEITYTDERNYISFTGAFDGSLGQCDDAIRAAYDDSTALSNELENVLAAWSAHHLKEIDARNEVQAIDIASALESLKSLDGQRLPEPEEGGRADDYEEWDYNEHSETIDSREVMKRIEYLNDFLCDLPDDVNIETYDPDEDANGDRSEAVEERAALRDLEASAAPYAPDWQYGETLIHADYFAEYAEQMVKDIGDMPQNIPNYIVIDWAATAKNMESDYTEVTFKDQTFLIR